MSHKLYYIIALLVLMVSAVAAQAQISVLDKINCGGGARTCFAQRTATDGSLACLCEAACVPGICNSTSVLALRGVNWKSCNPPITVKAQGGTKATNGPSFTAVFATATVLDALIGNFQSTQVDDCFDGLIEDDPQILGLCL